MIIGIEYTKFKVSRSVMYLDENIIVYYMLSIDNDLKEAYELLNEYKVFNSTNIIDDGQERLEELIINFIILVDPNFINFYRSITYN